MQLSPAQRHSARIAAERLLRQQQSLDSETSLHVQIAALEKDVAAAAAISNRAERMEFKRDVLLPRWMPTAQTWLESDSMHQNPVFAWCVIWLFDTGQFDQALDWADVAIERGQETPAAFGSAFPVFVADTVLAWAETEAAQGQDVEPYFSRTLGNVMQHWNMYEVIKAKYRLCGRAAYNACRKPEYYRDNQAGQSLAGCMLDRNAYQRVGCAVPYYGC